MSASEAPKWREDFPFESEDDEHVTRRDCARFLVLVSAGLTVGASIVGVKSRLAAPPVDVRLEIEGAAALPAGGSLTFRYPDAKTSAILIRRESGEFVAFLQACPHLACPVQYRRTESSAGEALVCPCHNGRFDIASGKGTSGPPRELRPLRRIVLEVEGDRVFAVGLAGHATA